MRFRDAGAADRPAILSLRARCFGDVDREKQSDAFWQWEFGRARITVAERDDGTIVSHLALIDLPHAIDGQTVAGALAVDAMTSPDARGEGAFSGVVQHAMRGSGHTVATAYQIRSAVLGAMLRGGWAVAERVPVLIRPIVPIVDRMRAAATRDQPRLLDRGDVGWMSACGVTDGCIARSASFLTWRFFDNPEWRYRVTGIGADAYLVTRRTTLKGFDTLAVVDLGFRDARAARALVRDAVAHAARERCTLAAAFVSRRHPAFGIMLRAGFLPGPHWFRLLVHPAPQAPRAWRVMWGDTDHL